MDLTQLGTFVLHLQLTQSVEIVNGLLSANLELCDLAPGVVVNMDPDGVDQLEISVYVVHHREFEGRRKVLLQHLTNVLNLLLPVLVPPFDLSIE